MPDGNGRQALVRPDGQPSAITAVAALSEVDLCAEVVLYSRVGERTVYSYRVPEALAATLQPGHLVEVPFSTRVLSGLVLSLDWVAAGSRRLRDITSVLDPIPCLTAAQLDLAHWMAAYYACPLDEALSVMTPAGLERAPVTTYALPADDVQPTSRQTLTPLQSQFIEVLRQRGPSSATRLAAGHDVKAAIAALESLARRNLIIRTRSLGRASVSERTEVIVVLQPRPSALRLTGRQRAIIEYLEAQGGEAPLAAIREDLELDSPTVMRLAAKRIVLAYTRQVRRDPLAHRTIASTQPLPLTPEQTQVYAPIRAALAAQDGSTFLLHGITGSGKTEVYLHAVADTLAAGRQAIVLVPEIGLTPQTVGRFAGRFPGQVALLHSRLGDGERFDEWQRIRRGECAVAVGPRSAIFSPFARVGLIVLDEEHDPSYKQDRSPRYHTREVATRLAQLTGAVVILGSATPDVVSYNRADRGKYRLLSMHTRVQRHTRPPATQDRRTPGNLTADARARAGLPPVQVVDMRLELKAGNRSIFSRVLLRELEHTLARREQAILFLNRRGNATFINCRDCGYVVKCTRCDLPFSYHSDGERLQCHRCDARAPQPTLCARCGSWRIRYFGLGTQKVELEIRARLPRARVERYDRDVTAGKFGHEVILERFARGETDILIGTQIVAKGLDFPRVTLVGAVSADTSLNLPDFRAAERTFDLLTQVAGRAGRADLQGSVIVQTYTPGHFAIQAAAHHDYTAFYQDEIRFRREAGYPPFAQLARLTFSARTGEACRMEAEQLAQHLQAWIETNPALALEMIGPAPCFINKANNRYYWQILLRGASIHPILSEVPRTWAIDVDPVSVL